MNISEAKGVWFLLVSVGVVGGLVLAGFVKERFNRHVTERSVRTLEAMKEYRETVRGHDPL